MRNLLRRSAHLVVAVSFTAGMSAFAGSATAQDMQTFLNNLNRQMEGAYNNYREGVRIYNSVPIEQRLDYKCAHGDRRACYIYQMQLNNANRCMMYHYGNLGR